MTLHLHKGPFNGEQVPGKWLITPLWDEGPRTGRDMEHNGSRALWEEWIPGVPISFRGGAITPQPCALFLLKSQPTSGNGSAEPILCSCFAYTQSAVLWEWLSGSSQLPRDCPSRLERLHPPAPVWLHLHTRIPMSGNSQFLITFTSKLLRILIFE